MARIHIELPDTFPFSTEISLYIGHMNYRNHLDNAQLLAIVSEARDRFFKSMGYSEGDVEGVGVIVADAALQYRSEAHHGETLRACVATTDFTRYGCDLVWQLAERDSGREVARGKTGIVFFDYAQRKVAMVPEPFRARFA